MTWQQLKPEDILPGNTLQIKYERDYVLLKEETWAAAISIPIRNWGGVPAGTGVGTQPEGGSDETSAGESGERSPEFLSAIRNNLAQLDGTFSSAVALLAGIPVDQLDEYGGADDGGFDD